MMSTKLFSLVDENFFGVVEKAGAGRSSSVGGEVVPPAPRDVDLEKILEKCFPSPLRYLDHYCLGDASASACDYDDVAEYFGLDDGQVETVDKKISKGETVDIISLLSWTPMGTPSRNFLVTPDGSEVDVNTLKGKYVVVCGVFLPIHNKLHQAAAARLWAVLSAAAAADCPFQLVIVPKLRPGFDSHLVIDHFFKAVPSTCLAIPYGCSISCDHVFNSLTLSDNLSLAALIVDPNGTVLQICFQCFYNFGIDAFPFTDQRLDTLTYITDLLKCRVDEVYFETDGLYFVDKTTLTSRRAPLRHCAPTFDETKITRGHAPTLDETKLTSRRVPPRGHVPTLDETKLTSRRAPTPSHAPTLDETKLTSRRVPPRSHAPTLDETKLTSRPRGHAPTLDETKLIPRRAPTPRHAPTLDDTKLIPCHVPTPRHVPTLDELLLCDPSHRLPLAADERVSVSVSNLNARYVGLYFCKTGFFMRYLSQLHQQCTSRGHQFDILIIPLAFFESPSSFVNCIRIGLSKYNVSSWWLFPYNDWVCRRLWNLTDRSPSDHLIILPPSGSGLSGELEGKAVTIHFGVDAYPFTRASIVERKLERLRKVTLKHLLPEDCTVSDLLSKKVFIYLDPKYPPSSRLLSYLSKIHHQHPDSVLIYAPPNSYKDDIGKEHPPWLVSRSLLTDVIPILFDEKEKIYDGTIVAVKNGQILSRRAQLHLNKMGAFPFSEYLREEIVSDLSFELDHLTG